MSGGTSQTSLRRRRRPASSSHSPTSRNPPTVRQECESAERSEDEGGGLGHAGPSTRRAQPIRGDQGDVQSVDNAIVVGVARRGKSCMQPVAGDIGDVQAVNDTVEVHVTGEGGRRVIRHTEPEDEDLAQRVEHELVRGLQEGRVVVERTTPRPETNRS